MGGALVRCGVRASDLSGEEDLHDSEWLADSSLGLVSCRSNFIRLMIRCDDSSCMYLWSQWQTEQDRIRTSSLVDREIPNNSSARSACAEWETWTIRVLRIWGETLRGDTILAVVLDSGEVLVYDLRLWLCILDLVDDFFLIERGSTLPAVGLGSFGVDSIFPVRTKVWRLLRGNGDEPSSSRRNESREVRIWASNASSSSIDGRLGVFSVGLLGGNGEILRGPKSLPPYELWELDRLIPLLGDADAERGVVDRWLVASLTVEARDVGRKDWGGCSVFYWWGPRKFHTRFWLTFIDRIFYWSIQRWRHNLFSVLILTISSCEL
jgi:hypothetical protein